MKYEVSQEVYDAAVNYSKAFMQVLQEKLELCECESQTIEVYEIAFNSLWFALRQVIAENDEENIERLVAHIRQHILTLLKKKS